MDFLNRYSRTILQDSLPLKNVTAGFRIGQKLKLKIIGVFQEKQSIDCQLV